MGIGFKRAQMTPDLLLGDVKSLALSVISHRLELSSTARAEDVRVIDLVIGALESMPLPKELLSR